MVLNCRRERSHSLELVDETAYGLKLTAPAQSVVKWPSMPKCDVLMVRHFYDRFIAEHVQCVLPDEEGADPQPQTQLVITGTPGIGKSAFGMYLLHRALNAGKTVVFVRNEQAVGVPHVTVFHDGAVWGALSIDHVNGLVLDRNVVYLYDGERPATLGYNTILITSPDKSLWTKFEKTGARLRYFPVFSLHELLQLQQLQPSISPEEVCERYDLAGGSARLVMNKLSEKENFAALDERACGITPSVLMKLHASPRVLAKEEMVHHLIHYKVDREIFFITGVAFASEQVRRMCEEHAKTGGKAELAAFMTAAEKYSVFASATGQMFEAQCPGRIAQGVACTLRPLSGAGTDKEEKFRAPSNVRINKFGHVDSIK
ncbi:MAG: hypothetical protein EOO65_05970, partial [Methanosarcinales archaeon]